MPTYALGEIEYQRPAMGGGPGPFGFWIGNADENDSSRCRVTLTYKTQEDATRAWNAAKSMIEDVVTISDL